MNQPFSIVCVTCRVRLTVRDAAAIGQILKCPKCHSMVLVEAPAGGAPATADSETVATAPAAGPAPAGPVPARQGVAKSSRAPAARSAKPEATSRPAAPPRQESKRSVPVAP
ncbi:MAG TPA: hypothetical protein VMX74_00370, partial [Pirellulales bacterium]|nr:hypothetical protein [Pirellulales bacterium]